MRKTRSWETEFGLEFEVPKQVLDLVERGLLVDTSWHNDAAPTFALPDGADGKYAALWVDHPVSAQREFPEWKRFRVCHGPCSSERGQGRPDFETDDVDEAIAELMLRKGLQ